MKKTLFLLFCLMASMGAWADGTELWNAGALTVDSWFGDAGWAPETNSTAVYADNKITINIAENKDGQWKAQVKINTGITYNTSKQYDFAFRATTNTTLGGITFKVDDNTGFLYENQSLTIDAATGLNYSKKNVQGTPGNGVIVFDFGYATAGTEIVLSDFSIIEHEPVAAGFPVVDPAATTSASSGNAALGCDGNTGTRWESASSDDQWWCVNYGEQKEMDHIKITWEGAYGKTFKIYGSNNATDWDEIVDVVDQTLNGFPYVQVFDLGAVKNYQYVLFRGIKRGTGYGYSFWEFETYKAASSVLTTLEFSASLIAKVGTDVVLNTVTKDQYGVIMPAEVSFSVSPADAGHIADGKYIADKAGLATVTATAGALSKDVAIFNYAGENVALSTNLATDNKIIAQSGEGEFAAGSAFDAYFAVDDNEGSVWQGSLTNGGSDAEDARTFDAWFVVDLGASYDVELVTINFEGACSQDYHVDFSANNTDWTTAYNYVGTPGIQGRTDYIFPGGEKNLTNNNSVRYVRFYSTKAGTQWGVKVFSFKVYGTEAIFTPVATEYGLVGDFNSWSGDTNGVVFYTTETANVLKATADEFTTGQWGFKVRKGTGWSDLYGCTNPISTATVETLDADHNIHIGQEQNNVTLHNAEFTITLDEAGVPQTLRVDADENINVADFHDKYIIVGTQTGWSFEHDYIELQYQSEGVYQANIDRFQGDLKVVKNMSWSNAYSTTAPLGLGDNTLTKGVDANAAFPSGCVLKNGVLTLTVNNENTLTLNVAGTLSEEHSYSLVGKFQDWNVATAPLFEEQSDGSFTLDMEEFPGNSQFKVSIDKTWTCYLAQSGVTNLANGEQYTCARADNNNNFTIGEEGKTYNAHFVLVPSADGSSATLTVTYFEPSAAVTLTKDDHTVNVLAVHYVGTNNYVVTITSDEVMNGLGGSFWRVNGEGVDMRNSMTRSEDGHTLTFTVTSDPAPELYTPLYIMMPGEVNFGMVTFDWIEVGTIPTVDVEVVSTVGYATMYYAEELTTDDDVKIYTASVSGDKLVLAELGSKTIPANTAVLVDGTASFTATTTGATFSGVNVLQGVLEATATSTLGEILVLGVDEEVPGFYTYAGATLGAHKAYIPKSAAGSAKGLKIVLEDETTGISDINMGNASDAIYNLAGQRVNAAQKGIVIVNGKKFVVK